MKTFTRISIALIGLSAFFIACQKEVSFEQGNTRASVGSLQSNVAGACLGSVVSGTYTKDTTLNATHFVNINVNVDTAGTYTIKSDTVNGYYFAATGTFTATGTQTVKLVGAGKPLAQGTNIFRVTYNGTTCEFSIIVIAGTGGTSVYTVNCATAVLNGTYVAGTAMTAANTVVLTVNVTAMGTWSLATTTVNGVTFSGSGTFTTTGSQTITLTAGGIPAAAGTFNYPVTVGGATCNFSCTFAAQPDYFPRTVFSNWSYQFDGDPDDSLLFKVIQPTFTVNGNTYNIFMATDGLTPFDSAGYYRRAGADYFEWIDIGTAIGFDDVLWVEYLFLKDNLNTGGTWNTQAFTGNVTPVGPVTARFLYTILQKDVPVTVLGTTYPNTIVVKEELQQLVAGNWVTLTAAGYLQSYYARDKGRIKQDYYDGMGALDTELDVRRINIY
jgi:hypothetical protein